MTVWRVAAQKVEEYAEALAPQSFLRNY
jgi:hypothetical protein